MNYVSKGTLYIKLLIIAATVMVFAIAQTRIAPNLEKVMASASGPSPSHTGAPSETSCVACHRSFPVNSGTGNITITGMPANYRPGQQIPLTVTVSQSDGVLYGFQLTSLDNAGRQAGTFNLPGGSPSRMQIVDNFVNGNLRLYVEHTIDGITPTQFGSKSWTFDWVAPALRVGKISFYAAGNAANSDGQTSGDYIYTTARSSLSGTAISNFDSDGLSDAAIYRPSTGTWWSRNSTNGNSQVISFGLSGDKIAPGDYDGDGVTDRVVFRPSSGVWYLLQSTAGFSALQFGLSGDVPVPGDYDGDGKTDIALYRPSTNIWYILQSTAGFRTEQFGASGDRTAQADFDGDGKTDIALYRPSTGVWYIARSTGGYDIRQFGLDGDQPTQADFDGDGKTDIAVFRPSTSIWYLQQSTAGFAATQFGVSTDKAVPADYDGDGKSDIAIFRPSTGVWYIIKSSDQTFSIFQFGSNGDIAVPSGYLAE